MTAYFQHPQSDSYRIKVELCMLYTVCLHIPYAYWRSSAARLLSAVSPLGFMQRNGVSSNVTTA